MKVRFPFPTSRNNQLREGSGWNRIEDSIQQMAEFINNGDDAVTQAVEAAEAAQDAAEAAQEAAEAAASEAMSGTPEGYALIANTVDNVVKDSFVCDTDKIVYDQGGLSSTSASTTSANNRIRTHSVLPNDIIGVKMPSDKYCWIYAFSDPTTYAGRYMTDGTFSKASGGTIADMSDFYFDSLPNALSTYTYKLVVVNKDNSNLTPSDTSGIKYYRYTDKKLSSSDKAADAKTTGDLIIGLNRSINDIAANTQILNGWNTEVTEVVTQNMAISDFRTAFNAKLSDYATLCKIDGSTSFNSLTTNENTWEKVYAAVNKVFRSPVYFAGLTHDMFCYRVNYAFTAPIRQFMDAKLNDGTARDFSIAFSERSGEPSAIVSEDGGTLYVYSIIGKKRYASADGIKWDSGTSLVFDTAYTPEHGNVNLIDGTYYMIGPDNNASSAGRELRLWTSSDGINFTHKGILIAKEHDFGNNEPITVWGNSYLIKDNGTFYLFIEAKSAETFWEIYLTTCTNILYHNDPNIGNWVDNAVNPVLGGTPFPASANVDAKGNPDFYKGPDNRPIRVNGKWLMLFHVTHNGASYIFRAVSSNLTDWSIENNLINNRDTPTAGESSSGNADQAIIGFKGRTYLFYTWDINSVNTPYIKYLVDDRPINDMMHVMA